MTNTKRSLGWIILHLLAITSILTNLLTGMRIATLGREDILWFSALLPQGALHDIHILGAIGLIAATFGYLFHHAIFEAKAGKMNIARRNWSSQYYRLVTWFGYLLVVISIISGGLLYFDLIEAIPVATLHFYSALGFAAYLLLHGGAYFIQYGLPAIKRILSPARAQTMLNIKVVLSTLVVFLLAWLLLAREHAISLVVKHIPIDEFVTIDGVADERIWQTTEGISVLTHGGANFIGGQTRVRIKAVENGVEAFLHISWDDPTKSLKHLPLMKTAEGWKVQQNGFHHFNETEFYEDKLAVLWADNCELGAAGTAHLGPKPLSDEPSNWHGKGYHYTTDEVVRDLWHWKAVRTNAMYLADDNFIGKPDIERAGSRRYTAGYLQDGKESGAYVMNWKWYKPGIVVPKRLPKQPQIIAPFQTDGDDLDWVIPWFEYEPYSSAKDIYPAGTIMPSVMYSSNRFEGDRADVRAHAVWQDGEWSLELSRKLDTGSAYDVPLKQGVCMWVSAFDHSQIAHTRHNQAIQLDFENNHD